MENFADEIEKLINDKLSLYGKIYDLLIEEKSYVAQVDVESLWKTVAEKKSLAYRVELIRHKIADLFSKKYPGFSPEPQTFGLSEVINRLKISLEKRQELEGKVLSINVKKDDIACQARENSRFINENLTIINGIFSTVMDKKAKEEAYTPMGNILKPDTKKRLFNAQV